MFIPKKIIALLFIAGLLFCTTVVGIFYGKRILNKERPIENVLNFNIEEHIHVKSLSLVLQKRQQLNQLIWQQNHLPRTFDNIKKTAQNHPAIFYPFR